MAVALGVNQTPVPQRVVEAIGAMYIDLASGLALANPICEPIFWEAPEGHVLAKDLCEGFMQAVSPLNEAWHRLTESGTHGHLSYKYLFKSLKIRGSRNWRYH